MAGATAIGRLGILTGGGDAPGLNAAIRAIVNSASRAGIACIGLEDGFDGLRHPERARPLTPRDVAGIHRLGGTILGTTNRGNPLARRGMPGVDAAAYVAACVDNLRALDLQAIVAIGGDGTLSIASNFAARGLPIIGIPKTIDNDVVETSVTLGFDSAVACATAAIDRLQTTAEAHRRVMVVEVMGRYTGWIGLHAGVAGGADVILLPELPFQYQAIADRIQARERLGARGTIVVVAEGAWPSGGARAVAAPGANGQEERLGGIAERVAAELQRLTGREARFEVLGHLQRGGGPSAADRLWAARFGAFAVELAARGERGVMVAAQSSGLTAVPLDRVAGRVQAIAASDALVCAARRLGVCFGDEIP